MSFYKKDAGELLVSHTRVEGPGFSLDAEKHTEHTYPVEGWYWFEDLDAAMAGLSGVDKADSISPRQIRQALTTMGLRSQVEEAVAAADQDTKDWWEFATSFEKQHPEVVAMATALGISQTQVDELFATAAAL